jgi:type I restriction enzyme, S subunit
MMIEPEQKLLPLCWEKTELGEILFLKNGFAFKSNSYQDAGIPVIRISDIQNGVVTTEFSVRIKGSEEFNNYSVNKGDVLIAMSGATTGKFGVYKANKSAFQNQRVGNFILYSDKLVDKKFIFFLLGNLKREIEKKAYGGAQPNISAKNIENLKFNLPPLPEQYQIVAKIEELFSELDNGIESLKKAREQLKTYRQAVLKYAFEGKLTEEWRTRQKEAGNPPEPAEKLLERIKAEREKHYQKQVEDWQKACEQAKADGKKKPAKPRKPKELPPLTEKELAELPVLSEGWGWTYFEYFGFWTGGGTPSKRKKEYWLDGNVLWISPKDMKKKYIKSTIDKITETAVEESSAKFIKSGSVLFVVRSGILRRTLPLSITTEISTVNQDLQALTPFEVNSEFIYWYSVANDFDIRNKCAKDGTTVESIETNALKNYKVPLPSLDEQQAIVSEIESRLSVCGQLEQTIEDSLKKSEALRQSILKKAFSGELTKDWREKHPGLVTGENSAEKLLEKIKAEKALLADRKKPRAGKKKKK